MIDEAQDEVAKLHRQIEDEQKQRKYDELFAKWDAIEQKEEEEQ